jgi:hypothetical protein
MKNDEEDIEEDIETLIRDNLDENLTWKVYSDIILFGNSEIDLRNLKDRDNGQ